jgi:hypothetical protein
VAVKLNCYSCMSVIKNFKQIRAVYSVVLFIAESYFRFLGISHSVVVVVVVVAIVVLLVVRCAIICSIF